MLATGEVRLSRFSPRGDATCHSDKSESLGSWSAAADAPALNNSTLKEALRSVRHPLYLVQKDGSMVAELGGVGRFGAAVGAAKLGLLTPILLFAFYTWSALQWTYSDGERAGFVQKFSKKGWLCKTWEGELAMVSMPGTNPEKFYFTVKDDDVAQHINGSLGKRVALTYQQHVGVPTTCFGETQYYVVAVKVVTQ
jgi:hypothetical protein